MTVRLARRARSTPLGRLRREELGAVVAVAAVAAAVAARPPFGAFGGVWVVGALVVAVGTFVAAAVVRRLGGPTGPAAWMAATALVVLGLALVGTGADRLPALLPVEHRWFAALLALVLPGLALTFPTGRLEHLVDRVAAVVVGTGGLAMVVVPVAAVVQPVAVGQCVAVCVAVLARFERARDLERERILWGLLGVGGVVVVDGHLLFALDGLAGLPDAAVIGTAVRTVAVICALAVPASFAVALVAPRALDVRSLIARVAAAVVMVDLTLGVFTGVLALVALASGHPAPPVVTSLLCVVVAAGFHPAFVRVRETIDAVLFGGRPDPVDVVSSLGAELRRGGGPQQWLDTLCAAAALSYAELHHDGDSVAVCGRPGGRPSATVPLLAGTEHVGDLVVGLPEHHRELPRATAAVLGLVAGPLARALQSARLAEEVQRSRRMVVLASEEERRRLRRDLHDGLGPVLAGVAYTADAARNVLGVRPERTAALLTELRADVAAAIGEVRRIVHDLRPPVLDQLGLVGAVRQQARRIARESGAPVVVVDAGPDALEALPAAVEVAAYRVVCEAMLNITRHAGARSATVALRRAGGTLELAVDDDGVAGGPWVPGVGLTSMRERLEQLGGELDAGATPHGGRVHARLPVALTVPSSGARRDAAP